MTQSWNSRASVCGNVDGHPHFIEGVPGGGTARAFYLIWPLKIFYRNFGSMTEKTSSSG